MGGVISAPPNPRPDLYIPVEGSPLAADVKANFPSGCSVWLARTLPLSLLRRGYDKVGADDNPPLKQDVVEDEILMPVAAAIPARPDYPELKAKLYQPASLKESKAESPLIVFWHGGGFCMVSLRLALLDWCGAPGW